MESLESDVPRQVLEAYGFERAAVTPVTIGLINRTFQVQHGDTRFVLQRLHPIFAAEVNLDIEAITDRLATAGLETPRLVRTKGGDAWVTADGAVHRVLTWVDGRTVERVTDPGVARAAAGLVARFHRALDGFAHDFQFTRPGAHDMQKHLASLREALRAHAEHPRHGEVRPIADRILSHADALPVIADDLPTRIIHGDLKISNVLFSPELDEAVALVDLDTMAESTLAIELGDALRSWCNPAGEDQPGAVDEAIFEAAVRGYARDAGGLTTAAEIASIVPGFETIALELAARFCADALNESYFGWSPDRFASRSEHNLVRARSQLHLAEAVRARRTGLGAVVDAAFAG